MVTRRFERPLKQSPSYLASDLLAAFREREVEAIERSGITHAPTIEAQYEGVSGSILKMMIPRTLALQVVSGFVEGIHGTLSGQIDGMLVCGSGTPIPGIQGQFKWPIKDVLAVLEVYLGEDLTDAHDQLQSVMALFWEYAGTIKPSDGIDISAPRYVYSQILGEPVPIEEKWDALPLDKAALYRMLLDDTLHRYASSSAMAASRTNTHYGKVFSASSDRII